MKLLLTLFLIAGVVYSGTISPELLQEMSTSENSDLFYVLIKAVGSVDTDYIAAATQGMTRDERREFAAGVMKDRSAEAQAGILQELTTFGIESVQDVQPFWIVNAIAASLSPEVIEQIVIRNDVLFIRLMNTENALIEPVDNRPVTQDELSKGIAWGVSQIGAPDAWALGYDGSGVLVSVVDTGVNYNHVDLQNNMWASGPYTNGWDFKDNDGDPMDTSGHGTHCAGSVAGDGTAGTQTGVAPGATIMALRVDTSVNPAAELTIWLAFQFSIDNGADVISTSLGYLQEWDPDRVSWRESEENLLAAGICHSVAAGNEGGSPYSYGDIRTPGDCPPPWLHPDQTTSGGLSAVVTVGATDINDDIAAFSSRGYSTWKFDAPWYDYNDTSPNIGLIDPDISGPGVDIVSCSLSPTGYTTKSGTSMATPHIAGCMALVLHANHWLTPAQVDSILEVTALDFGGSGKDNVFGSGRVRAYEAVLAALSVPIAGGSGGASAPELLLAPAGPNPVFSSLMFDLYTGSFTKMEISIYDIGGRVIDVIHSGELTGGNHSFTWGIPENMSCGIYFLRAETPIETATMRFTVLK